MTELELYLAEIKKIVARNVANGTPEQISPEIEQYRRARNVSKKINDQVRAAIKETVAKMEAGFVTERVAGVSETVTEYYIRSEATIAKSVRETVARAMRQGKSDEEIRVVLAGDLKIASRNVGTIQNTTRSALVRSQALADTEVAGSPFFQYEGRKYAARPFCREHLHNVYHRAEIDAMSNGQGLSPVIIYCGGYNCAHRWVGVSLETARAYRPEWFDNDGNLKTNELIKR